MTSMEDIVAMDVDMLEAESLTADFDNTEQQDNEQNQSVKDVTEPEEKPASTSTGQSEISHASDKSSVAKEDDSDTKHEDTPRPNVLFLYGLDEMSTNDIKAYCKGLNMQRIEWINDSSCNLVFATEEEAVAAATALLEQEVELTHTLLRKSKVHVREDRTFENLHIRVATTADVKARGARERSRYYLLHGTEESSYNRDRLNDDSVPIMSRLGVRRGRDESDVFSRLGRRREDSRRSRSDNRKHDRGRDRSRRRSMSPIQRRPTISNDAGSQAEDNELPAELPESLKGRLGPKQTAV